MKEETRISNIPPKISVVMPVYNGGVFLREAIESILTQTYTDFEFIIINDGSTDGSLTIMREYEARDARIHVIDQKNAGIVCALNAGIQASRGEYIARMDADDISLPKRFEKQLQYIEREHASMCGTWAIAIDSEGRELYMMKYPKKRWCANTWYLIRGNPFIHPTVLIKKSVLDAVGGYRPYKHIEDYELWTRIVPMYVSVNMTEVLYKYRIHGNQITRSHNLTMRLRGIGVRVEAILRIICGMIIKNQTHSA